MTNRKLNVSPRGNLRESFNASIESKSDLSIFLIRIKEQTFCDTFFTPARCQFDSITITESTFIKDDQNLQKFN